MRLRKSACCRSRAQCSDASCRCLGSSELWKTREELETCGGTEEACKVRHAIDFHNFFLMSFIRQCANNISDTQALEEYWDKYHVRDNELRLEDTPPDSPAVLRTSLKADHPLRSRSSLSDAAGLETTKPFLAPYHPALSLPDFLENFGPLIFPLYRASLLRKRILIVTEAPVQISCDYGMSMNRYLKLSLIDPSLCACTAIISSPITLCLL